MSGPSMAWLSDGERLHLQHGPIDLIIKVDGQQDEVERAYRAACRRFATMLADLVDELPSLRSECPSSGLGLKGLVAKRMEAAVRPLWSYRVTPMAAVAGAVADEVLSVLMTGRTLDRAYVNNGGDIALMLGPKSCFDIAMIARPDQPKVLGSISLEADDGVGGLATSGRHGRSHSLGIADSVTVLARDAAAADAASTLIANAVDLPEHPAIERVEARDLNPDSDLHDRLVTIGVGRLDARETAAALDRGVDLAESLFKKGLIKAAALSLGDQQRLVGRLPAWRVSQTDAFIAKHHENFSTPKEVCLARG